MLAIFVSEPSHDRTKIKTNRGHQNLRQLGNYVLTWHFVFAFKCWKSWLEPIQIEESKFFSSIQVFHLVNVIFLSFELCFFTAFQSKLFCVSSFQLQGHCISRISTLHLRGLICVSRLLLETLHVTSFSSILYWIIIENHSWLALTTSQINV